MGVCIRPAAGCKQGAGCARARHTSGPVRSRFCGGRRLHDKLPAVDTPELHLEWLMLCHLLVIAASCYHWEVRHNPPEDERPRARRRTRCTVVPIRVQLCPWKRLVHTASPVPGLPPRSGWWCASPAARACPALLRGRRAVQPTARRGVAQMLSLLDIDKCVACACARSASRRIWRICAWVRTPHAGDAQRDEPGPALRRNKRRAF